MLKNKNNINNINNLYKDKLQDLNYKEMSELIKKLSEDTFNNNFKNVNSLVSVFDFYMKKEDIYRKYFTIQALHSVELNKLIELGLNNELLHYCYSLDFFLNRFENFYNCLNIFNIVNKSEKVEKYILKDLFFSLEIAYTEINVNINYNEILNNLKQYVLNCENDLDNLKKNNFDLNFFNSLKCKVELFEFLFNDYESKVKEFKNIQIKMEKTKK